MEASVLRSLRLLVAQLLAAVFRAAFLNGQRRFFVEATDLRVATPSRRGFSV